LKKGFGFGYLLGGFTGTLASGVSANKWFALMIAGLSTATSTCAGGAIGYGLGYGGANLSLNAFPTAKNKESRLLLEPGFKPQFSLMIGVLLFPKIISSLANRPKLIDKVTVTENVSNSSPRL